MEHRRSIPLCVLTFLLLAAPLSAEMAGDQGAPAGEYNLDKSHASLVFRVNHLGFSMFTARFTRFDAKLMFDPAHPENSHLEVTIDATSLQTDFPNPEMLDFNKHLQDPDWLDTAQYPVITYRANAVELTKPNQGLIKGELTLHGVTQPVVLDVTFNGGYPGMEMDPHGRVGFSARGTLKRSAFGISYGIPAPGTTMGVGDDIDVVIEVEFSGPAWIAPKY